MDLVPTALVGGWYLGSNYGAARAREGQHQNRTGWLEHIAPVIRSWVETGRLEIYSWAGLAWLGPKGLAAKSASKEFGPQAPQPFSGKAHQLQEAKSTGEGEFGVAEGDAPRAAPLLERVSTRTSKGEFRVAQADVPTFLAQYGVQILSGEALCKRLQQCLPTDLRLVDCSVVSPVDDLAGLQAYPPNRTVISLHFGLDFADYLADSTGFEDRVKCEVLRAMGLDPDLAPNLKHFLKVIEVKEGSVQVVLFMLGCIFVASAVVGAIVSNVFGLGYTKPPRNDADTGVPASTVEQPDAAGTTFGGVDLAPADGSLAQRQDVGAAVADASGSADDAGAGLAPEDVLQGGEASSAAVPLREVRYINYPDGSYEIHGRLSEDQDWTQVDWPIFGGRDEVENHKE